MEIASSDDPPSDAKLIFSVPSRFSLETEKLGNRHAYKSSGSCLGRSYRPENIVPMLFVLPAS